jgi:hypothetical protein
VSQRAAWVLVPRPLNYRLSDAASTHAAPRNGGASASGADVEHGASEAPSSSFAFRNHDQVQANAVSQRAAWLLVPRPLHYRLGMLYRRTLRQEIVAHLLRGHTWSMKHREHLVGAWRCIIMLGCRQMLCRRELRGCWCRGRCITAWGCCIDVRCAKK